MKQVTPGQVAEMCARFPQTPWSEIDGDILQEVIKLPPAELGSRFARFLQNGARFVFGSPPVLQLGKAFNPADFFKNKEWTVWRGKADGKGMEGELAIYEPEDLAELNGQEMIFEHFLVGKETTITGEVKFDRARNSGKVLPGGRSFLTLLCDYQINKENSFLEWLRRNRGITWMDFPGLILRSPDGNRYVLFLYWSGEQWHWLCSWLRNDWNRDDPSALLASIKKQALGS